MSASSKRLILAITCLVFFALGVMTAALGPNLPGMADNAASTLEAVGSVYTGMFLGALVAQLAAGQVTGRLGQRRVLLWGCLLLAAGTLLLTLGRSLGLLFVFAVLAGLGHGAVDLAGNVWIAQLFQERGVSALNLLNFFFGLGGFAGPAAAGLALGWWGTALPALWLSVALVLLAAPALVLARGRADPAAPAVHPGQRPAAGAGLYASLGLWAMSFLILVYVGTENGMGGWTTTFMQRSAQLSPERAALATSVFWLALTAGRMTSTALGLRVSSHKLLVGHLLGALAGAAVLWLSVGNTLLSILAVGIIGFCFGPTYPTMMAIITRAFPAEAGKAAGLAAAMGSVGGMLLPWLQGVILERLGTAPSALFTCCMTVIMAGIALALFGRLGPRRVTAVRLEES
jgi:FHS family glucose/mannose:H+ symporter-like MFS transporter